MIDAPGYDIIGDVHGYCDELIALLIKMGYQCESNMYVHPEGRIPIFVGDLVDKGPKVRDTLILVKSMCDAGKAMCIMGNHEYNAVNFWTHNKTDGKDFYRPHTRVNIIQHYNTIKAFQNRDDEWNIFLEWMSNLPVMIENNKFRIVHASYHPLMSNVIENVKPCSKSPNKEILKLSREGDHIGWLVYGNTIQKIVESVLKGCKISLPEGVYFYDKDGNIRTKARAKFWLNSNEVTYDKYIVDNMPEHGTLMKNQVDISCIDKNYVNGYSTDEVPLFFGHYGIKMDVKPNTQSDNVCCLDYAGYLVAYRFDNENKLRNDKFVYVTKSV
jgi:hypothetical protein